MRSSNKITWLVSPGSSGILAFILFLSGLSFRASSQLPDPANYAYSGAESRNYDENNLFGGDDILEMQLETDLGNLIWDISDSASYHDAVISYSTPGGDRVSIPCRVQTRGHYRRERSTCSFPPLKFRFSSQDTRGTLFEGHTRLKAVTHCRTENPAYEQFCIREYLLYRIYNLITEISFRVRLVRIRYTETVGREKEIIRYAFFIEDNDKVAYRNHATVEAAVNVSQRITNQRVMAYFAVFQYMIGNTDWSLYYDHNVEYLRPLDGGRILPVPYDFDFSGAIQTPYAIPDPKIPIVNVRQRIYRGNCMEEEDMKAVVEAFNRSRAGIRELYETCTPLKNQARKSTLKYFEKFYEIINDRKQMEREFKSPCDG